MQRHDQVRARHYLDGNRTSLSSSLPSYLPSRSSLEAKVNFSEVRGPARGLNMASQPLWSLANAAASSRTSGFIKNVLYGGVTFTCTPSTSSSAATIGPTAATTMRPYGRQWHSQNHSASLKALTALALYFPHWVPGGSHKARGPRLSFATLGTSCEST